MDLTDGTGKILLGMGIPGQIPHPVVNHKSMKTHPVQFFSEGVALDEAAHTAVAAAGADHGYGMHLAVTQQVRFERIAVLAVGIAVFPKTGKKILHNGSAPFLFPLV